MLGVLYCDIHVVALVNVFCRNFKDQILKSSVYEGLDSNRQQVTYDTINRSGADNTSLFI